MPSSLELPARPRSRQQSRIRRVAVTAAVVLIPASWLVWYVNTPSELPVAAREISDTAVSGQSVYVGMFTAPNGFDRTLHVSGVKVHTVATTTEVEVTPLLCRGGTVTVTTAPDVFCAELVNPEGEPFTDGDTILVDVRADQPAAVVVERIEIGFREGIRSGTLPAGIRRAGITVVQSGGDAPAA
jgi:hypothetical protein